MKQTRRDFTKLAGTFCVGFPFLGLNVFSQFKKTEYGEYDQRLILDCRKVAIKENIPLTWFPNWERIVKKTGDEALCCVEFRFLGWDEFREFMNGNNEKRKTIINRAKFFYGKILNF